MRIVTDLNALNYYSHVLNPTFSPACRFCLNADETFHHLALECPATLQTRREFFEDRDITTKMDWKVDEILDFSYSDQINPLLDSNNVHDIRLTDSESEGKDATG